MGNFTKAHAKWWDDNAKETERSDSKRKKAVMNAQDDKPKNTYEAIAPQRKLTPAEIQAEKQMQALGAKNAKAKAADDERVRKASSGKPKNIYEAIAPQRKTK